MEDDKIKTFFTKYNPGLSSESEFMSRLEKNLKSVEIIRKNTAEIKSKCRVAVAIAVVAGFIAGFLFSLVLPYLADTVLKWQLSLPGTSVIKYMADYFSLITWLLAGATSVLVALNAYELSLSLMKTKELY